MYNKYLIKFSRRTNNRWYLEQEDYEKIEIVRLRVYQLLKDSIHPTKNLIVLYKTNDNFEDITDEVIKNMKL